jgi:hypothetical protein
MGIVRCFGWEIQTVTNKVVALCYVITNMNKLVIWSNQNASI